MNMQQIEEFYRGKKVLVTGHTGFKGSWLIRILTMAGAKVTGYALEAPTVPSLFEIADLEEVITHVRGDVRDLSHLKKIFDQVKPEIVFHLAAQPIVRDSYRRPVYTYETNVMGTVHVLECVRQTLTVKSFLNVTTDKVYENKEWEYGYRESDCLDGYDPYSNSKSCSELVTHSYAKSFFEDGRCRISTARAGNVIGGGDFATDRIVPDCVRAAEAGKDIVVRNPYSVRPYQHVLEPLAAYLTIAMRQYEDREAEGSYNVGPDDCDCITTGELADLFCAAWGRDLKWVNRYDGGPHEANFLKLDCSRIKAVFGWQPRYHVKEAVEKTVEWAKAYMEGQDIRPLMDRQIQEFFSPPAKSCLAGGVSASGTIGKR
ncbi:CDP-glucose 4,6-dehydratase [Lachnospiraceae bacterium 62-35]